MHSIKQYVVVLLMVLLLGPVLYAESTIKIALSNNKVKQGDTLKVEILSSKLLRKAELHMAGLTFRAFKSKRRGPDQLFRYIAYIGIGRRWALKRHFLDFDLQFSSRDSYQTRYKVWVRDGGFKKEFITLKKEKHALSKDRVSISKENRLIKNAVSLRTETKYFDTPFLMPVKKARITSPFGGMRVYNGKPAWSHSGLDLAKRQGVPIFAANTGKVVLVKDLKVHGTTVMIDHGWGIVSIYNHLSESSVRLRQKVKKGEEIGKMGDTGVATGPHLHWGMAVQNVRVDPSQWVKRKFLVD